MVSSGDVPSDFNLASFFVRPYFRVFQHNRSMAVHPYPVGNRPQWVESRDCRSLSSESERTLAA
jgi:hypothetical protein